MAHALHSALRRSGRDWRGLARGLSARSPVRRFACGRDVGARVGFDRALRAWWSVSRSRGRLTPERGIEIESARSHSPSHRLDFRSVCVPTSPGPDGLDRILESNYLVAASPKGCIFTCHSHAPATKHEEQPVRDHLPRAGRLSSPRSTIFVKPASRLSP